MYENIGAKIKGLAKIIFFIGVIVTAIASIVFIINMGPIGLILLIIGLIIAWVNSLLLYGFGELIDKVCEIAKNTQTVKHRLAVINTHEDIENNEKIQSSSPQAK